MKFAVLSRCPTIGGKVSGFDDEESKKISGVSFVGKISDSAVAVVADSVWSAMEGRRVLNVTWDDGPNRDLNTAAVMASLKQSASKKSVSLFLGRRSLQGSRAPHHGRIRIAFHGPCAHGTGQLHGALSGRRSANCGRRRRFRRIAATRSRRRSRLDPDQVKVNVTLMGGGFGRRLEHDYAVEAALVSKAINAPVKVIWTREDDMRFSTYRPASLHQLSATLDGTGFPVALDASHHRALDQRTKRTADFRTEWIPTCPMKPDPVYGLPNYSIEYVLAETPVPLGWMRSVYALQAAFALESFIDELAVAAGQRSAAIPAASAGERSGLAVFHDHLAHGAHARPCCNWPQRKRDGTSPCPRATIAASPALAVSRRTWRKSSRSPWRTISRACIAWSRWSTADKS